MKANLLGYFVKFRQSEKATQIKIHIVEAFSEWPNLKKTVKLVSNLLVFTSMTGLVEDFGAEL